MYKKLVFVTNNPHKLREIRSIIGNDIEVLSLKDIGMSEEIQENEPTLEGNASAKSRFIFGKFAIDCFADDTGLEIEALDGRPGVRSARYAGEDCIPENNIRKVLDEMERAENRNARFRTVISLILGGKEIQFEGIVNGTILHEKRGISGFGYDPVFLPDGYKLTFAQMTLEEKNCISHRALAIQKLIGHLRHLRLLR